MNAFTTDLRELVAKHLAKVPTDALVQLVEELTDADEPSQISPPFVSEIRAGFSNLDDEGMLTDGDHVAVYQHSTALIWTAMPLQGGKELTHEEAMKAAAGLELLGKKDWRLPTIQELLSIIDYGRYDPAVDPKYFKGPYGFAWSSTVAKYPAGFAWYVSLDDGDSSRGFRGGHGRALAVRAGQQLGLSV